MRTVLVLSSQKAHLWLLMLKLPAERRVLNAIVTLDLLNATEVLPTLALTRGELTNLSNCTSVRWCSSSGVLPEQIITGGEQSETRRGSYAQIAKESAKGELHMF